MTTKNINVGRTGVFNGLFGNPVREKTVSAEYAIHFRRVMQEHPKELEWLKARLQQGYILFCPGCGISSPTCHARVIEREIYFADY